MEVSTPNQVTTSSVFFIKLNSLRPWKYVRYCLSFTIALICASVFYCFELRCLKISMIAKLLKKTFQGITTGAFHYDIEI